MPINNFIKRITRQPGRYVLSSGAMLRQGITVEIEVDHDGKVYQLRQPDRVRDDELRPGGWLGDEVILDARSVDTSFDNKD
jgi:hemin uptake protein HemP